MKKHVLLAKMLMVMAFTGALTWGSMSSAFAQINYSFNFDANSTGWTGEFARFTGATACGGTGGSMRRNLYSSVQTGQMISPNVGTSNGMPATISYDYKAAVWSANTAGAPTPWGTFNVQYGASATGPWTTFATVTNEAQNGSCIGKTHTGVTLPAGNTFIRWEATWQGGDYFLNFDNVVITQQPAMDCSGTPSPGNTLSTQASVCVSQNFTLSLQNTDIGAGISFQWQTSANGVDWTNAGGSPNAPSWSTTQSSATYYRCVVSCSFSAESTASNPVLVNQNLPTQCYCTPVYTFGKTDGDLISQVQITGTTLNNNSGTAPVNPAYTYFTGQPQYTGNLQAGTTYNVNVTYGSFTSQQCAVWIDFNENGVFELSERVGFTTSNSTSAFQTVSFPISLPCNPVPGVKRMRVRNVYFTNGNTIDPCATYSYGETEDYDVTILPPPPCPMITGLTAGTPGSFNVVLNWNQGCAESAWNVEYGPVGFTPGTGTTVPAGTNVNFNLTGLNSSTNYHIYVSANCGVDGSSNPFGPIAITTDIAPCSGTPTQSNTVSSVANACLAQNFTLSMSETYNDLQIVYQWQSSPNNIDWTDISGATNPTRVQTQSVATWYRCVVTCNASGQSMFSTPIQVNMGLPTQCYCEPTYAIGKTDGDLISNVVIPGTTLSNNSGTAAVNPAYTYFTGQPNFTANLVQGGSYNVTISIGTWGDQGLRAWIDYNDNGVFEASESIGATTVAPGGGFNAGGFPPAIFPVNLSLSAPLGTHRMRIRSSYFTTPSTIDPCANYTFGETEDYDITIVAPITTQLQSNFCNISNVTMDMPIRAINVNVPQYRFRIVGANNGGQGWNGNTFILDRPSRDFKFSMVPGSLWGTTYTIDVAAGDGFGNYGPYAATCTVSLLAAIPTTQLQASDCGAVNVDPAVNLLANTITSATGYRFQVNGPGVAPNTVVTKTMGGGAMRKLKMQEVAGIMLGETYSVEVAIRDAAGNWGAYGNSCSVTLMGAPNVVINDNIEMVQNRNLSEVSFGVSASHNPFTTEFGLQVLNANDTETINVAIYDMSGKLIERHAVNPMDIEATTFGSNLASGMYMVEVRQGANQAVVRQVKN